MKQESGRRNVMVLGLLGLLVVGGTSGCASKKYVRTQVDESARNVTATLEPRIEENQHKIHANTSQIEELGSVTGQHSQQISMLDEKSQQALMKGEGAQNIADLAVTQVSSLEGKFLNRNRYVVLSEESVRFNFDSASIQEPYRAPLDGIAQQLKGDPNAILVLEGRTDATGDELYNVRLGEKRVDAVVRYLVVEQGVPLHKVYKLSFGEAKPAASNDTPAGRAQNRAVVVRVMGSGSAEAQNTVVSKTSEMSAQP